MTQFGAHSESTSPARKRIEQRALELGAARREAERAKAIDAERAARDAEAEREALAAYAVVKEAADRRRRELSDRFERAFLASKDRTYTMREIVEETARKHGVTANEILGDGRRKVAVIPRREAMWLCHTLTSHSASAIGRFFGGRDHTTILHAIKRYEEHLAETRAALDMEGA